MQKLFVMLFSGMIGCHRRKISSPNQNTYQNGYPLRYTDKNVRLRIPRQLLVCAWQISHHINIDFNSDRTADTLKRIIYYSLKMMFFVSALQLVSFGRLVFTITRKTTSHTWPLLHTTISSLTLSNHIMNTTDWFLFPCSVWLYFISTPSFYLIRLCNPFQKF